MTRKIRAFGRPTKRMSASGAHCGASRYELASNPTVSHTGRRKSSRSISIRPRSATRRSKSSYTAARGVAGQPRDSGISGRDVRDDRRNLHRA